MNRREWLEISARMTLYWPQAETPDESLALFYEDLKDQEGGKVLAAVESLHRDPAQVWPPNSGQILYRLAEIDLDAPSWMELKAELTRRGSAPGTVASPWQEPCPFGVCDGRGFIVDEDARMSTACECRPGKIEQAKAVAADALTANPVVAAFIADVGTGELDDVRAGDRVAEAQVRTKWEGFVLERIREVTWAGIPTAGLRGLERRAEMRAMGAAVRAVLEGGEL
jgi:hypothetical protein